MSLSCLFRRTSLNIFDNQGKYFLRTVISPALIKSSTTHSDSSNALVSKNAVARFSTSKAMLSSGHGDHAKMWTFERVISAVLLPVVPIAFYAPSAVGDLVLATLTVMHTHWGVEAIVIDYVRASIFGPVIPKIGVGLVYVFSIGVLAGLLNLTFNDIGLVNTIKLFWSL